MFNGTLTEAVLNVWVFSKLGGWQRKGVRYRLRGDTPGNSTPVVRTLPCWATRDPDRDSDSFLHSDSSSDLTKHLLN